MHPQYWTPGIAGWRIPNGCRRCRTGNHAFTSSCLYSGSAVSPSRNVAVPIFLQSSEGTAIVVFFKPSHQNRSHPVIWNCFLFRTSHLLMPASSSVMPWGIGEYRGMGHFQNKGAAGGLDLRHPYFSKTRSFLSEGTLQNTRKFKCVKVIL